MTEKDKMWLWIGGAAVVLLAIWWWLNQGSQVAPDGQSISVPTSDVLGVPSYTPASFSFTPPSPGAALSNPGSSAIFNFNPAPTPALSGTGSPDGATAPCNCPADASSMTYYGTLGDAAQAAAPLFQYLADQLPPVDTTSQYDIAQYGGDVLQATLRKFKAHNEAIKAAASQVWGETWGSGNVISL